MSSLDLARALIGQPDARTRLPTPALIVDLDALDANIAHMAQRAKAANVALRPHAKTHKSAFIARKQIDAGAVGVCCAKLGEAEALIAAGVRGVLLTSPLPPDAAARAAALAKRDPSLRLVVDHLDQVDALAATGAPIHLVIDVDVGLGRTGIASPRAAVDLARRITQSPQLKLIGVQAYGGAWQHMAGLDKRTSAVRAGLPRLTDTIDALRADGNAFTLVTGGGTGTVSIDLAEGVFTELQPGSYVFMDAQYADALGADDDGAFAQSLFVSAQIVSANHPKWVTVDAGLKAFATEAGVPRAATPRFKDCAYFFFGDEHGGLMRPKDDAPLPLGTRIEFIPPHCDPTVDRYDCYCLVRGAALIDVIPIDAARRAQ